MPAVLDPDQIDAGLAVLDGWTRDGDSIVRTAQLPGFLAAIDVVTLVARIAEARDHHPDIDIRWRTLTFRCATHSAGGVTAKDLELAGEIDAVLAKAG
jgi:4a-hydroxytetrahydrobiopterin dehydratase